VKVYLYGKNYATSIQNYAAIHEYLSGLNPGLFFYGQDPINDLVESLGGCRIGAMCDKGLSLIGELNDLRIHGDPAQEGYSKSLCRLFTAARFEEIDRLTAMGTLHAAHVFYDTIYAQLEDACEIHGLA
jgi:hypothetical protein